ncbi:MAG: hypothetical protein ACE14L_17990 [Terriglobales bacterium]
MISPGKKPAVRKRPRKSARPRQRRSRQWISAPVVALVLLMIGGVALGAWQFHAHYTVGLQSPVRIRFQWPLVISARMNTEDAVLSQDDQGRPLTAHQQYACRKFGPACRIALAIQRAENTRGDCEVWHYNTNGTLDWGYFQINTVHLTRPGLNLRDLLDCRANIDFAYELYKERGFQPWSTYNNGAYRKYLHLR